MSTVTNMVEPLRHLKIFSPASFGNACIDIIGVGATGSRIAMSLAKLGIQRMRIFDPDTIEKHNIANQLFGLNDVGKPKVVALAEMIKLQTGLVVEPVQEYVTGRTVLRDVVFMLTDTMKSRKEIWEGAVRYHPNIKIMVETRMGADQGRVYTVRPTTPADIKSWEEVWKPDEQSSESLCGSAITVGPTAELVSGYAVWQFIRWFNWTMKSDSAKPEFELIFFTNPPMAVTRS